MGFKASIETDGVRRLIGVGLVFSVFRLLWIKTSTDPKSFWFLSTLDVEISKV